MVIHLILFHLVDISHNFSLSIYRFFFVHQLLFSHSFFYKHLFMILKLWTWLVWTLSEFPSSMSFFPSIFLYQNIYFLFLRRKEIGLSEPQKDTYHLILWYIWQTRNKQIFSTEKRSPRMTPYNSLFSMQRIGTS